MTEETLFDDRTGKIMNPSLAEYHVPVHLDVPYIEVIYNDIPDEHSLLVAHGVGKIGIVGVAAAIAVQGDISKSADVKRLFEETKKAFGSPSILVNNAAIYEFGPVEAITEEEFHRLFNINVLGIFLTIQEALKYFPGTGGSIINISTVGSKNTAPNTSLYASTKGAVDTLTSALAKELGSRKIRVNAIAPGVTETEGTHRQGLIGSDMEKMILAATPLGRLGQPNDIARATVFLASEEASWITGERIAVSGGLG